MIILQVFRPKTGTCFAEMVEYEFRTVDAAIEAAGLYHSQRQWILWERFEGRADSYIPHSSLNSNRTK